jgi:peptidoglycan/LPS O-acetylase OafA/YrhL
MICFHISAAFVFSKIIAADAMGENNFVVRFFSKDDFVRYAKLTYAVYLIQPIVISLTFGMLGNAIHVDFAEFVSRESEIRRPY